MADSQKNLSGRLLRPERLFLNPVTSVVGRSFLRKR
jgi:hypothetical protein